MLTAKEIRESFKQFFASKEHQIVPSAPMVVKGDPTLMFTNAGMNQFKDIILGNVPRKYPRVADSQKCLRVSGKHNDLEEVGHDTYHHTMFEMLGNWSFGDYFKKEAINWAWEYLVEVLKLNPERLYATVFEGSPAEGLDRDNEAAGYWEQYLPKDHILNGNKHDNFWEMGDTGPCGPCSEIHIDLRSDEERAAVSGADMVNKDHPQVIEIWNLVFMQFNRKADGSLEPLPAKVIDTGMGFERLCMALQGKTSNYDTDVFQPIIKVIAGMAGTTYGTDKQQDIAMRVIADHIRTIAFAITDGQLPSNAKAGYVIRRILRRAVRYGYTFLDRKEAFMYKLLPVLIETMGDAYPELIAQKTLIEKVIKEEEESFLRTLETGIRLLDKKMEETKAAGKTVLNGVDAFTLYDTYGFPLDLTELILRENGMEADIEEFNKAMQKQKERARTAAAMIPLAVTASVASITEPIDFLFCFVSPLLWVAHAVITGGFMVLLHVLHVRAFTSNLLGSLVFNLSAGEQLQNLPLLYLLGLAEILTYFAVFSILIKAKDLPTPGREAAPSTDQSPYADPQEVCQFIAALGGPENIAQLGNCFTRLRLTVRDASLLDMGALLSLPHKGLVVQGTRVQLVCGLHAAQLRHALEQQLAEMAPV